MKTNPTKKSLLRFNYFVQCKDEQRLPKIPLNETGFTAAECFHVMETYGKLLPCKEPALLSRALNGKSQHGITVTMCAQDYVNRILFAIDLKTNYPDWMRKDILGRARQIALEQVGYVPTFVLTGEDFTTIK